MIEVELKAILSKPMSKAGLLKYIRTQQPDIVTLLHISLDKDYEVAFRASWMLEYAIDSPIKFFNNARQIADAFYKLRNYSCLRSYSKILREQDENMLNDAGIDLDAIIEKSFECVIDSTCPVAVKANCLDVLFKLRSHNSWLKDELKAQLIYLLGSDSPALLSRCKFLLSRWRDS